MEGSRITAAVVVVSDTRDEQSDTSGKLLVGLLEVDGVEVAEYQFVHDEFDPLREVLIRLSARSDVDLILTTGGTGLGPRDVTPEATRSIIESEIPGIGEAIRVGSLQFTPMAMLSRGVSGVRERTLIINLPGSQKAVKQCYAILRPVLGHAVELIKGNTEHRTDADAH